MLCACHSFCCHLCHSWDCLWFSCCHHGYTKNLAEALPHTNQKGAHKGRFSGHILIINNCRYSLQERMLSILVLLSGEYSYIEAMKFFFWSSSDSIQVVGGKVWRNLLLSDLLSSISYISIYATMINPNYIMILVTNSGNMVGLLASLVYQMSLGAMIKEICFRKGRIWYFISFKMLQEYIVEDLQGCYTPPKLDPEHEERLKMLKLL